MNALERKVNAIAAVVLSGSDAEQEAAKRRLRAVLAELPEAAAAKSLENEIRALLLEIGIRDNLKVITT